MSAQQDPADENAETETETGSVEEHDANVREAGQPDGDAPGDANADAAEGPEDDTTESAIDGLRMQLQQRDEALLRLQAELENLRKRGRRDVENAHKYGIEKLVAELLPVKDSMELGLASGSDADVGALHQGMSLTDKMLAGVLEKFGVEIVDPAGQNFDPERHQAMSMQEVEGTAPGTVVTVFQKGYVLNDRLVRPAMVIVSK